MDKYDARKLSGPELNQRKKSLTTSATRQALVNAGSARVVNLGSAGQSYLNQIMICVASQFTLCLTGHDQSCTIVRVPTSFCWAMTTSLTVQRIALRTIRPCMTEG